MFTEIDSRLSQASAAAMHLPKSPGNLHNLDDSPSLVSIQPLCIPYTLKMSRC